jgi:hypothetical protein
VIPTIHTEAEVKRLPGIVEMISHRPRQYSKSAAIKRSQGNLPSDLTQRPGARVIIEKIDADSQWLQRGPSGRRVTRYHVLWFVPDVGGAA